MTTVMTIYMNSRSLFKQCDIVCIYLSRLKFSSRLIDRAMSIVLALGGNALRLLGHVTPSNTLGMCWMFHPISPIGLGTWMLIDTSSSSSHIYSMHIYAYYFFQGKALHRADVHVPWGMPHWGAWCNTHEIQANLVSSTVALPKEDPPAEESINTTVGPHWPRSTVNMPPKTD